MNNNRSSKSTFAGHLSESFWLSQGRIITVFGFVLTIITFLLLPKDLTVGLRYVVPLAIIGIYLIFWLWYAAWSAFYYGLSTSPALRYGLQPPAAFAGVALLLFDPSPVYAHDSTVTLYFVDNDFERFIGIGKVVNQEDGKIQVLVVKDIGFGNGWDAVAQNDASKLKLIRIKPTVPFLAFAMEDLTNE